MGCKLQQKWLLMVNWTFSCHCANRNQSRCPSVRSVRGPSMEPQCIVLNLSIGMCASMLPNQYTPTVHPMCRWKHFLRIRWKSYSAPTFENMGSPTYCYAHFDNSPQADFGPKLACKVDLLKPAAQPLRSGPFDGQTNYRIDYTPKSVECHCPAAYLSKNKVSPDGYTFEVRSRATRSVCDFTQV